MTLRIKVPVAITALAAAMAISNIGCTNNPYPAGESKRNVHYLNFGEDPKSLDPTFSFTTVESNVLDVITPSYFRYHYLQQNPVRLVLNLGTKEPTRTRTPDGGEVWTFTVRKDLRFSNDVCFPDSKGRAITAADFIYAWKRMADPKIGYPLTGVFEDNVIGWKEYAAAFSQDRKGMADPNYDKPFPGVTADPNDPYTFSIHLKRPYPQLRFIMAMHHTTPQAREAVEHYNDEYARHPVGCGAYKLTSYTPKQRLVLERNENASPDIYPTEGDPGDREAGLLADAGKQLPPTDTLVFDMVRESTSSWNLFLQGYLDETTLNANNFQQAMASNGMLSPKMQEMGIELRRAQQSAVYYILFNMKDPLWGGYTPEKRKLRQAVSLVLDSQEFIDLALQGNGTPAQWMLPAGIFGYDKDFKHPYRVVDIERAKKLIAEAGYPGGKDPKTGERLVIYIDCAAITAAARTQYGILKRQIERTGIKVEIRSTPGSIFRDKLLKGSHQSILYGWFADYPDPENFVFLLYGLNAGPGKPNYAWYQNPEYDKLFEKVRDMDDSPERLTLLNQMRDMAVEDSAWIPFYHPEVVTMSHSWVTNTKVHPIARDVLLYRKIDNNLRAQKQLAWNKPVWWPLFAFIGLSIASAIPAAIVVRRRVNRKLRAGGGAS